MEMVPAGPTKEVKKLASIMIGSNEGLIAIENLAHEHTPKQGRGIARGKEQDERNKTS